MKKVLSLLLLLTLMITIGCSTEESDATLFEESNLSSSEIFVNALTAKGKHDRPPVWADCEGFTGLVVPAKFKPGTHAFDELYAVVDGNGPTPAFKDGKPLISDSKPGDQDYNGGRWHMNVLKPGVSVDKYADACSEEDLDLNDFMSTDMYFECPLLKEKKK